MNDLEDLVRQELRSRVDAVEARQAATPLADLMNRLDQRIRRARIRRRWTTSALGAVAVAAAITIPLTSLSPGTRIMPNVALPAASVQLSDTSATPKGWVPVAFGAVQISVPADWRVGSRPCDRAAQGYVVIGTASTPLAVRNPRCKRAANVAVIRVLPLGQGRTHRRTGYINRIPLLGIRPVARGYASYLAPTLHALISVRGPLSNKVLGALTRSPFSVVLEAGPRIPVPDSWRWHDFGGIRFAAPPQWRTIKSRLWNPCWATISSTRAVKLIKANGTALIDCSDLGGGITPRSGVVIGAGQYVAPHRPAEYGCRSLRGN